MRPRCLALVAACLLTACTKTPPPPGAQPPNTGEPIRGNERVGWDQEATDSAALNGFRYVIYVDGARSELTSVSCANSASAAGFACTAALPRMASGRHSLELASFTDNGELLESPRSPAFVVVVSGAVTRGLVDGSDPYQGAATRESPGAVRRSLEAITTTDGVRWRIDQVAGDLNVPTDLAFLPDGRMVIAEREGRVRIVAPGAAAASPASPIDEVTLSGEGGLLSIAVDPEFERTHWLYAIYTTQSASGAPVFRLARFREVENLLAERAVLLDDIPVSPLRPAASIRFGLDRKLYVALDDGGDARAAGDLASLNGKILRLNGDGTTPDDQVNPVYSAEHHSPRGFDWHSGGQVLWTVDGDATESVRISALSAGRPGRATVRAMYGLPDGASAFGMAVYRCSLVPAFRDNLLIASGSGNLLRVRIDANDATRPVAVERMLERQIGSVRAVTVGPGCSIYLATETAVVRLKTE